MRRSLLCCAALLAAASASLVHAGGPLGVCNNAPLKYTSNAVALNYDQGVLGTRTKAQADAIVNAAIAMWTNVTTSSINLSRAPSDLSTNVTHANYPSYIGSGTFSDGVNPVVYDTDGRIIEAMFGTGNQSSVLGFAGSASFGAPTCRYAEGQAVINGFISVSDAVMTTVIAHEIGHLIGMDHSQLDNTQGLAGANYPLMYPIAYRTLISLHEDDVAAVSALYPDATLNSVYGQVSGTFTNGATALRGGNLWAREINTNRVYSIVSDYLKQNTGYFKLLLPAGTYTLRAEAIASDFDGGSSVGPYSDIYPSDPSFQAPFYNAGVPMSPVTLGNASPMQIGITAGCAATVAFQLNGTGTIGGNCSAGVTSHTLTAAKSGNGGGTVTSSPAGIDCGATCSAGFASGTVVTLTPAASAGSAFGGWSGACTGSAACTVTMSAARSVTATFNLSDDYPDVFSSAPAIALISATAGNLGTAGDVDWFRFDFPGPGTWTIRTSGSTDTVGAAYAPDGTTLYGSNDDAEAPNFMMTFPIGAATTVYLEVTGYNGVTTGPYVLASWYTADDYPDVFSLASPASLNGSTAAQLHSAADVDWFRFDFPGPGSWTVRSTGGTDTLGTAYAPNGTTVYGTSDNAEGANFAMTFAIGAATSVYLKVGGRVAGNYSVVSSFSPAPAGSRPEDFNRDGKSDILYRNSITGQIYRMLMDGFTPVSGLLAYQEPNLAWKIVGDGDFNGGGTSDLLWRNEVTGHVSVALFDSSGLLTTTGAVIAEANLAWKIVGTPDLDGDGLTDVLWWNSSTGQVWAMLMNFNQIVTQGSVYLEPNLDWKIAAVGDFSGSGKKNQLLWRNGATGQVYLMTVNYASGAFNQTGVTIYSEPNLAWKIIGAADFNGDGKTDILWRNESTGQVFMLHMNGASVIGAGLVYHEPDLAWRIVAHGDYNGDGRADLLWRNEATGHVYMMLMDGMAIASARLVYHEPNTAWKILGPGEYGAGGS